MSEQDQTVVQSSPRKHKNSFTLEDRAVLVVVSGTELGRTYLLDERETVIGRDPSCELILDDEGISKEHCLIRADKGYFFIEDLKSSNGTYVDGKKIKKRSLLNDFERIVLGNTILRFFMEESL
ncbi:MAG: FHA domain-containing protein [Spirochaetales bacterium]|nr:FHA domain-containing protein [Spirochaetales bacterium]